jgi:hypothetical protein
MVIHYYWNAVGALVLKRERQSNFSAVDLTVRFGFDNKFKFVILG